MPICHVTFAVTAGPLEIHQIHAQDREQAIQLATDWARHILDTVEHAMCLGEVLKAEEVAP